MQINCENLKFAFLLYVAEIKVLKSVNKLYFGPKWEKVGQYIQNVLFSKSGKWHDPKNFEIISKIKGSTCRLPNSKRGIISRASKLLNLSYKAIYCALKLIKFSPLKIELDKYLNAVKNRTYYGFLCLIAFLFSCQGKPQCSFVPNSISMGVDPCKGFFKYLEINYICVKSKSSSSLHH
jgi:hypothetical protein